MVLQEKPRESRVVSDEDSMPGLAWLCLGNVEKHDELVPQSLDNDVKTN